MLSKPLLSLLLASLTVLAQTAPASGSSVKSSTYNAILRMTKYAAASYASSCPTPPNNSTVVQYFNNEQTDTQATLFRDDDRKELIIALRGTSDLQDFQIDFATALVPLTAIGTNACQGCEVHNGTQTAWNSISSSVLSAMQTQLQQHPRYTPIVTGHSLGGALCSIASASLVHSFPNLRSYSLGQFRTGNQAYADFIDSILPYPNFFRITHTNDGVPQTVQKSAGYAHHSTEFWELEPFGPAKTYRCQPGDDAECNQSTLGLGLFGANSSEGINPAHLCYTGVLIGNPIDAGASACNAFSLLPQQCSTATLGGIL